MDCLIILLSGHAGSGKTTAAELISEYYGPLLREFALADKLKHMTYDIVENNSTLQEFKQNIINTITNIQYKHHTK